MLQREVGTTGLRVSVVGLGCSRFGSIGSGIGNRQAVMLIDRAYELGINLFDTASIYGQGDSERLLGKTLQRRRDQVVIVSKAGYELSAVGGLISRYAKPAAKQRDLHGAAAFVGVRADGDRSIRDPVPL